MQLDTFLERRTATSKVKTSATGLKPTSKAVPPSFTIDFNVNGFWLPYMR